MPNTKITLELPEEIILRAAERAAQEDATYSEIMRDGWKSRPPELKQGIVSGKNRPTLV